MILDYFQKSVLVFLPRKGTDLQIYYHVSAISTSLNKQHYTLVVYLQKECVRHTPR